MVISEESTEEIKKVESIYYKLIYKLIKEIPIDSFDFDYINSLIEGFKYINGILLDLGLEDHSHLKKINDKIKELEYNAR
jgi:hypothetical protein